MTARNPHGSLDYDTPEPPPVPAATSLAGVRIVSSNNGHNEVTIVFRDRVEAHAWAVWLFEMQAVAS